MLKVDGIVNVSRDFAATAFENLHTYCSTDACLEAQKFEFLRHLLVRLNDASALPFSIQDLVENYKANAPASAHASASAHAPASIPQLDQ